jgi:hypothetical protein
MIRTLLRPTTLTRSAPRTILAGRSVTTRAPTNSSGGATTEISGTLAYVIFVLVIALYKSEQNNRSRRKTRGSGSGTW